MFIDCKVDLVFLSSVSAPGQFTLDTILSNLLFGACSSIVHVVILCHLGFQIHEIFSIANCRKLCQTFDIWSKNKIICASWPSYVYEIESKKKVYYNHKFHRTNPTFHRNKMAYEEKKKMLFDCLRTAEKSIIGTSLEQKESHTGHLPQRNDSKVVGRRFQGRESIFKRPAAPISKCLKPRRAPDYQVCSSLIFIQCFHQKIYSLDFSVPGESTQMEKVFIVRCRHIRSHKHISCICISQGNRET